MAKALASIIPEIVSAVQGSRTGVSAGIGAAAALIGLQSQNQEEEEKIPVIVGQESVPQARDIFQSARLPLPVQEQSEPPTEDEDQQYVLDANGLRPLTEQEMLEGYRPEPGVQISEHIRNYMLFQDDAIQPVEEEEHIEFVSVGDEEAQSLLSDFGQQLDSQQNDAVDIRRIDPERSRAIQQTLRNIFPNLDSVTTRRLTKAIIILTIAKKIPPTFTSIKDFIEKYGRPVWEWIFANKPQQTNSGVQQSVAEYMNNQLPPHCTRRLFFRNGKVISLVVCSDEQGSRLYENK